ncbi:hypothetical protein [Micromonospora sp. NPDC048839]|uniref:hypothetical protein n=1 Tax=Micromonospora sp. NPDC048839 TaxID=3155641 RepID=UPI0033F5C0E6
MAGLDHDDVFLPRPVIRLAAGGSQLAGGRARADALGGFALSSAFKRVYGISPQEHRGAALAR